MRKSMIQGPVTEPPPQLAAILEHMMLRPLKVPDGSSIPDLCLDKKAVKSLFQRQALLACSSFLLCASNERLKIEFRPHISDEAWRTAMGPDDELERIHYLAGRVGADMMRAAGVSP
ncbi:MAG TPA: hypothetical protein DHW63_05250 [Hyphomonadaceae bacterium]|nr:hypothetical protein [Hyphomonadaceae bacterium]